MEKLLSLIKRHPYRTIIVVGAIGVVVAVSIIYTTIDATFRNSFLLLALISIPLLVIVLLIAVKWKAITIVVFAVVGAGIGLLIGAYSYYDSVISAMTGTVIGAVLGSAAILFIRRYRTRRK